MKTKMNKISINIDETLYHEFRKACVSRKSLIQSGYIEAMSNLLDKYESEGYQANPKKRSISAGSFVPKELYTKLMAFHKAKNVTLTSLWKEAMRRYVLEASELDQTYKAYMALGSVEPKVLRALASLREKNNA